METPSAPEATVKSADRVAPPKLADRVTVPEVHAEVVTSKFALVFPGVTSTLPGTLAIPGLLLDTATAAPPAGAGALRVTVPVDAAPPVKLLGARLKEESVVAGNEVTKS
jgi:hypothetical protein